MIYRYIVGGACWRFIRVCSNIGSLTINRGLYTRQTELVSATQGQYTTDNLPVSQSVSNKPHISLSAQLVRIVFV